MTGVVRAPRATLVVTQREGYRASCASLDDIYAHTDEPFHLIYCDAGSPADLAADLRERAQRHQFTLIRWEGWTWPNLARRQAMQHVTTEFTVFVDNDVTVEPGWLSQLLATADETKAALVAPLYLIARPGQDTVIHMAGGALRRRQGPRGAMLLEAHLLSDAPISRRAELRRASCDYVEFHCVLARTDFLRGGAALDPNILAVHEHIDLSLQAHAQGAPVVFEPAAAITYHPPARLDTFDRAVYVRRWASQAVEASIAAFCRKWDLVDDPAAFDGVRTFAKYHWEMADPLVRGRTRIKSVDDVVGRGVPQTWVSFANHTAGLGYNGIELNAFLRAYRISQTLFSGGFRLCGRPFICHLAGTASLLASYGAGPYLVMAGLLHAVYTHGYAPEGSKSLATISAHIRKQCGAQTDLILQAYSHYTLGLTPYPDNPACADEIELAALVLSHANRAEEFLNGEATSTHDDVPSPDPTFQSLGKLSPYLQAPWLPAVEGRAVRVASLSRVPPLMPESYWLRPGSDAPVPMRHRSFAEWKGSGAPTAHI